MRTCASCGRSFPVSVMLLRELEYPATTWRENVPEGYAICLFCHAKGVTENDELPF